MKWIATSPTAAWCEKAPQSPETSPQLFVTGRRQQAIDGFGGCFNEIGWQALHALPADRRTHVLRDLFDPATGCGYRLCLAFQTPERSTVVICANPFSDQVEVVMAVASERFLLCLDAHSFNTVVLDGQARRTESNYGVQWEAAPDI